MLIQGQVGPSSAQSAQPGATPAIRQGQQGDLIASELHGRFYEQTYRGAMFSISTAALTTMTANHVALTSTSTPMVGVWNPPGSGVNIVVLQSSLQLVPTTFTTPVPPGTLAWAAQVNQTAITTGVAPWNRRSLTRNGSAVKAFDGSTALTGLANNLTIFETADFTGQPNLTYGTLASTVLLPSIGGVQNFDGQLIVPPGGVLSLVGTTSTTTFAYIARLLWEEVPI
jgi:hypothetical protein